LDYLVKIKEFSIAYNDVRYPPEVSEANTPGRSTEEANLLAEGGLGREGEEKFKIRRFIM